MKARALKVLIFILPTVLLLAIGPLAPSLRGQTASASCPGNFTCDFEEGNLRGWTSTGTAFYNQPTLGDNPTARNRGQPSHHQGSWWIGTYEDYQGRPGQAPGKVQRDGPRGSLTSAHFTIQPGTLTFLIGGGSGPATLVELIVHDPIDAHDTQVLQATGSNTETMRRVSWDLAPHAGKTGSIRIVDDSSDEWGHINVDDFRFMGNMGEFHGEGIATLPGNVMVNPPAAIVQTQPPKARIEPSELRVPAGGTATFRSQTEAGSGSGILQISWQGPEGRTGKGPRFTIDTQGMSPGEYEITLSVLNTRGQTARATAMLEVISPLPPLTAMIHPSYVSAQQGQRVTFMNRSPVDPDTPLTHQDWSGPGGQSGHDNSFTVSTGGLAPGIHSVKLFLEDKRGRRAETTATLEIALRKIDVSLIAGKTVVEVGEEVGFTALSNVSDQGPAYLFTFGDEQQSGWTQAADAQHSFTHPGTYSVQVQVRLAGRTATSNVVTVAVEEGPPPPVAVIDPPGATVAKGEAAEFHSLSTPAGEISETWRGPDNQAGTGPYFKIDTNDLEPRAYPVTLEVEDDRHRTARAKAEVIVTEEEVSQPPFPYIILGVEPNPTPKGTVVRLFARAHRQPEGVEYQFKVNEAIIRDWSPDPQTQHIFQEKGTYTATASMRAGNNLRWQSKPVTIRVGSAIPLLVYAGLGLLAAAGAYIIWRFYQRPKKPRGGRMPVQANPQPDAGTQTLEFAAHSGPLPEISVRPVLDKGEQIIDIEDLLISKRR